MAGLSKDLVVVEASGKLRQLYTLLDRIGLHATCVATLGHLLESPGHLRPLCIARQQRGEYEETRRVTPRPEVHARLVEEVRSLRGRLLIATDDDQEGHAIAVDVASLARMLRPELVPLRVRMTALTEEALRAALASAAPMANELARPAMARRIADRLLASALSRPQEGLIVGRVTTAIAGLARAGAFPTHAVTLAVPASDGQGVFAARAWVRNESQASELLAIAASVHSLSPSGSATAVALAPPPTQASFLMAMGEGGRLSLSQAAQLLQGLYESGVVSYPRTAAQFYRPKTAHSIAKFAQARGLRVDAQLAVGAFAHDEAHEPLHVVDPRALATCELSKPLALVRDQRTMALTWISRQMAESVLQVERERGDAEALPGQLRELAWDRIRGALPPWVRQPRSGIRALSQEQSLLQGLVTAGIGRPSTHVGHVVRAIERHIVTHNNALAPEGERLLRAAPSAMADAACARAIELHAYEATARGVGSSVDGMLALAAGRQGALLAEITRLLEEPEAKEPEHAFVP